MKLLGIYKNGNYRVRIYDDGTKVRETIDPNDNKFIAEFPESIDLKITNRCDMGCKMCHENSTIDGAHGDINLSFLDSIQPYTEIAIGGGNPLEHPQLLHILQKLKNNKVIVNMTVNQEHFKKFEIVIKSLMRGKLIHGLGVSVSAYDSKLINTIKSMDNVVLHVIAGLIDYSELKKYYDQNLKLLILGYKDFRRGHDLYVGVNRSRINFYIDLLKLNIHEVVKHFNVVSFDNLAIKQLLLQNELSKDAWNQFYQGDDGSHTFYIDMVNQKFARNSISKERFDLLPTVTEMFQKLQN